MNDAVQSIALPNSLDALAIGVGAISGALHARRRHMDVMGILVVAFCAALGGGVIRDILLVSGPPVFLTSPVFLIYAAVGATIGWLFSRYASRATILMEVIDGLFIGVWVLVGATKALGNGLGFGSAILVAVITATGGGVLRDLFSGEQVSLLLPGILAGITKPPRGTRWASGGSRCIVYRNSFDFTAKVCPAARFLVCCAWGATRSPATPTPCARLSFSMAVEMICLI